ncbi:MAG TPA: MerR family transcriptional regulator [Trebonia sp.]|jgi:DNA-binding transcriptional MerR regulator
MADRRVPHDPAGCLRSGEVAAAAGVNVQTLHYYERLGLLAQAGRTAAGHRQYPARTVTLVRMIKNAQRLGFSLDEVARLIAAGADPDEITAIAARKLTEIDAQIARLTAIRDALALAASVADHDREQLTQTKPHWLETP